MTIAMWTFYDSPDDMPGYFVARRFIVKDGQIIVTTEHLADKSLTPVLAWFADKPYTWLPRSPEDHPNVLGSYME